MRLADHWSDGIWISVFATMLMMIVLTGCGTVGTPSFSDANQPPVSLTEDSGNSDSQKMEVSAETDQMFYIHIGDSVIPVLAAKNSSAEAFLEFLQSRNLSIELEDYGNFEKTGPIGTSLPSNDEQITTELGDIILYQGNQIAIYYGKNSWNLTRLGKVQESSQAELKAILGNGNLSVIFSLSDEEMDSKNS